MVSSFTAASGVLFGSGLSMWRLPQEPQQSQWATSIMAGRALIQGSFAVPWKPLA